MLRPRTPPLKAKLQASLNTMESVTISNPNTNTTGENNNNNNPVLNMTTSNNLTYIDSTTNEAQSSFIINNLKETENNDS